MKAAASASGATATKRLLVAAGAYLLFVVYGSLVPMDFHPRPLDAAWQEFLRTRYLALGVGSRADWVANILLYLPLSYLLCALFAGAAKSGIARFGGIVAAAVACGSVAIGVEFAQLFFPPRTVSLNDITAEFIGTGLGIAAWVTWGGALRRLGAAIDDGGLPAIRTAVVVYVLAYLALSLFPYDFLVSAHEFAEKFGKGGYGFLVTSETCGRLTGCAGKLVAEVVAVVPLGVLLGMALGATARRPYAIAAACGLALGLAIELAQLFIASGISDGISLLTRAAGMAVGVALHRHVRLQNLVTLRPYIVVAIVAALPVYLVALMWANAWFSAGWIGVDAAAAKWDKVRWLPFYYHYYTTETHALRSLLSVVAMYAPVGIGYWLWTLRPMRGRAGSAALIPALIAAPLAFVMEMGKLFVRGKQPDPTDVLIAMATGAAACVLAARMHQWALQGMPASSAATDAGAPPAAGAPATGSNRGWRPWLALLLLSGTGLALWNHPLGGAWLSVALGLYAAVLWRYPGACLPAVLAMLPWLDLSSWSGWILLNEFDLLMAVTLAVRLLRRPEAGAQSPLPTGAKPAIVLLAASFFASAFVGLFPLSPFDSNALGSYYTTFNSLRELKGFAWALALLPLLIAETRDGPRSERRWMAGMLAGLCGVTAVILWQRLAFSSLLDFGGVYRVEGTFPELHTGGGDVHAYLAMAIPFVVAWAVGKPSGARILGGALLFMLASYALGVTFTRGGYIAYGGAMAVLGVAIARHWMHQSTWKFRRAAVTAVVALTGLSILLTILSGAFMEARIAGTHAEATTRTQHWMRAVDEMDADVPTLLFGMGLGMFPRTALFKNADAASATFSFVREGDNGFVRLGSGKPLFLDQRITVAPGKRYTLSVDLRSANPQAKLDVHLCEKSVQYSFRCKIASIPLRGATTAWEHHEIALDAGDIGSGMGLLRRPVALSLTNAQRGGIVDADNVRLIDESGHDRVVNGDFSRGGARWSFSADDHLPWHIFNLWVQILFEQGWFGVVAVTLAVAASIARLGSGAWRGDLFCGALLAATIGFVLAGLTESLFDGPRVTTLFFLIVFAGLVRPAARADTAGRQIHPDSSARRGAGL